MHVNHEMLVAQLDADLNLVVLSAAGVANRISHQFTGHQDGVSSYTQKLWMRVKKKAAYLPG